MLLPNNSETKFKIENETGDILYRGIKNRLSIYTPKADSISVNGVGVAKEGKHKYSITPSIGNSLEISIVSYFKGKATHEKQKFRILNIEKPFASINREIGKITLSNEELANSTIEYFIPKLILKLAKVGKFRYQINDEEPKIKYGNKFNKSARKEIYRMKSGDSIVIDELSFQPELQTVDLKKVEKLVVIIK